MNLSSLHRPEEPTGARELLELLLHGSLGGTGLRDDLAKVERTRWRGLRDSRYDPETLCPWEGSYEQSVA